MKKPKVRPPLKARGFDGSAGARSRIEHLAQPRDGTWSMLPAAAVRDRLLGPCSPLHVLAWLCKYRNTKTGECFPSIERMARDLGITARSVQRHMEKLIEGGHVVVLPRRNSMGKQTSNSYFVLYGDVPAAPDREEAPQTEPGATETTKAPGEPVLASGAGVTLYVTPDPAGVTQDVTPTPQEVTIRGDTECRGGVTRSVARGDAQCHPNYPTDSIPLDDPSAEAARGRARAAASADEGDGGSQSGKPVTEPGETPEEARQEESGVESRTPDEQLRLSRMIADLSLIARITGTPWDQLKGKTGRWRADLEDIGLDRLTAEMVIADTARRVPKTCFAIKGMEERITGFIVGKQSKAAA